MIVASIIALWTVIAVVGFLVWQSSIGRERVQERFELATELADSEDDPQTQVYRGTRRLSRNWIWLPWVLGIGIALTVWIFFQWPIQYVLAIGLVVSLLLNQLENYLHSRHIARLERQLADTIDIMIGAVSAGAAVGPAIDAATIESERPLKPYLEELSGRIRFGDDPIQVFRSLADRVPLETFLLFSSSLVVHFESGGRLAPTLATVGRTIRDRIEVTRRIQSNIAQSQFSTFAILGLVYF
ncbi:MAG: type II secretion system F family protein, partial [Planctomycetota bacterium]